MIYITEEYLDVLRGLLNNSTQLLHTVLAAFSLIVVALLLISGAMVWIARICKHQQAVLTAQQRALSDLVVLNVKLVEQVENLYHQGEDRIV